MGHTFWTATRMVREAPPSGWTFERWPKTESNFTLKSPKVAIEVENGLDMLRKSKNLEREVPGDVKKLFLVRVFDPDEQYQPLWCNPDEMPEKVIDLAKELTVRYPFEMREVPKPKYRPKPVMHDVPELIPVDIEFPIGSYVKVVSGPYPAIMKNKVQRIDQRKPGEALVTRWLERRSRWGSAWVPLEHLSPVAEADIPTNVCLQFGSRQSGSALDMYRRGHCVYCTLKSECKWWQKEFGSEEL